jgi:replicative DNA helicase
LQRAVDDYRRMIAPNMRILEGNEQPTVNDIRAIAQVMAEHDGRAPIVFIDYLQLLAPLSERFDTDKRNADRNVSELRKMARDLKTHVWCISSLNRSSYSGVISLDSFKESGMIEYGADNLLGLQPRDMAGQLESVSEQKQKRAAEKIVKDNKAKHERDCELVVLKQRNGALPDAPMPITFKPMAAYFSEPTARRDDTPARRVI